MKNIAVLAKNTSVLKFLREYFDCRKNYRASYDSNPAFFLEKIDGKRPYVVIAEGALLQKVADKITGLPTIAVIHGNTRDDIEDAINCQAKSYILKPYLDIDLEHKLSSVIANKDAIEQMENELKELESIVDLTQLILSTLDPKELLQRIVTKVAEIIPVTRCSIIKVEKRRRAAFVVSSFEDPDITGIKLSLGRYPEIDEALKSRKPVVINDVAKNPMMGKVRKFIAPLGIRSILVVPILLRDKVIGTLFLRTSRTGHTFSPNEIRLLTSLANASASVLHNAFLFEQVESEKARLERLAITDYLTGIYNVRYFYHRIIEEFSRSERYGLPISCLMIDIDFFKKVNDKYGHKTGDAVLKEFARHLKKHTRKSDVVARYGGEEFILLLPLTRLDGAIAEAERIRAYIENHHFRGLKGKGGLTVSIGVASYPHRKIKTYDDLISCADNALFIAKHKGRNCSVTYEDKVTPSRKGDRKGSFSRRGGRV